MQLTRREFTKVAATVAAGAILPRMTMGATATGGAGGSSELTSLTLAEAAAKIRSGEVTSVQLTEACLARIAVYDPKLDAFITVMKEQALAQARQLDAELKAGKIRGVLHGVPVAAKDNIDTADARTTAASALFEDRVPSEDAPVITRLKESGAVIIGKTNLQEFAMGIGETSYWGPARNPYALDRNTGGSSSGSGAAVAAELCYGALGTDTGGSIRIPASFCGLVGMKGTYGLVPIRGVVPLIFSLDHCGPMTRTVEDNALMLSCLAGYDKYDISSIEHPKEDYVAALKQPISGLRLGIPPYYFDHLDPEVAKAVQDALDVLKKLTASTKEVNLPAIANRGMIGGEMLAYHEEYIKRAAGKYMPLTRKRLEAALPIQPKASEYVRARWELDLLRRTINDAFTDFDLVVLPTERVLPPLLNDLFKALNTGAGIAEATANTGPFDVYGTPALTLPCGYSKSGLPIGLTISGPRFSEGKILALAHAYEKATEWHKRRPNLSPDMPVPAVNVG